jgi:molybdate transport system substrate-binding protein
MRGLVRAGFVIMSAIACARSAPAAEIRVLSVGAPQHAEKLLAADYAKASGDSVTFTIGSPAIVEGKLKAGETSDVLVMSAAAMDVFEKTGGLRAGTRKALACTEIGVAWREGAALPDLSSLDAFKKLMLDVHSLVYGDPSIPNQSGAVAATILSKAGILDAVKAKVRHESLGPGLELIAKGEVEAGLFNVSEILPAKGVKLAGPVPWPLFYCTTYDAAVMDEAAEPESALAFIKFMTVGLDRDSPHSVAVRERWRAAGLNASPPAAK